MAITTPLLARPSTRALLITGTATMDFGAVARMPNSDVDFSVEMVVRPNSNTGFKHWMNHGGAAGSAGWYVESPSSGSALRGFVVNDTAYYAQTGTLTVTSWYWLCWVYAAAANTVQLYYKAIGGDFVVGNSSSSIPNMSAASANMIVGGGEGNSCDADFALVRVWSKALSAGEAKQVAGKRIVYAGQSRYRGLVFHYDPGQSLNLDSLGMASAARTGTIAFTAGVVPQLPWVDDPKIMLAHVVAPATGGTTFTSSLGGSVTAAGALTKQANKAFAGTSTATGALTKLAAKALAGSGTAAGALAKQAQKAFAGSSTAAGALTKAASKALAGATTAAGAIAKLVTKPAFAGTSTATGALAKQAQKVFAGSSTATGALTLVRAVLLSLAGSVTATGALTKQAQKALAGTSTATGSLVKTALKAFAGSSTPAGALSLIRAVLLSLSGSVTATGALTKSTAKALAGSVTPAGALAKAVTKAAFTGSVTCAGALAKVTSKALAGSVTPAATLVRFVSKALGGAVTAAGALVTSGGTATALHVIARLFGLHESTLRGRGIDEATQRAGAEEHATIRRKGLDD